MVEMIILPGGMPGATNLNNHIGLKLQIEKFAKENRYLAAICAAPLVYGNLGILNGKQAVCYPGFESYLKGAQILNLPVVEYQNLITSKGPGSVFEFALKIIEKLVSKEKAALVASQMLLR
jgi:4-methyl-5(b-hydroxyethyl)-thiazole monophosphate biosynthesis